MTATLQVNDSDPASPQTAALSGTGINRCAHARSLAPAVWKSAVECKGISQVNCETNESSRCKSKP